MNLNAMLPSLARKAIYEQAYKGLLGARLNCYGNPIYTVVTLWDDLNNIADDVTPQLNDMAYEELKRALEDYDSKYPISWDNEKQQAYRLINGERKTW